MSDWLVRHRWVMMIENSIMAKMVLMKMVSLVREMNDWLFKNMWWVNITEKKISLEYNFYVTICSAQNVQ